MTKLLQTHNTRYKHNINGAILVSDINMYIVLAIIYFTYICI